MDLFGWSRGAVAALTLAEILKDDGVTYKGRVYKPVKVRFMGLIDPVATGGYQMVGTNSTVIPQTCVSRTLRMRDSKHGSDGGYSRQHIRSRRTYQYLFAGPDVQLFTRNWSFHGVERGGGTQGRRGFRGRSIRIEDKGCTL